MLLIAQYIFIDFINFRRTCKSLHNILQHMYISTNFTDTKSLVDQLNNEFHQNFCLYRKNHELTCIKKINILKIYNPMNVWMDD